MVQIRNNMRDKGIYNLKMAYKVDPDNLELKEKLADVHLKNGEIEKADTLSREAHELDPNNAETYYIMGKVH